MPLDAILVDGQTPLHVAAMKNNITYLHENPTAEELLTLFLGNTPLLWAIASTSVDFALRLLDLPHTTHINIKSEQALYLNSPLILSIAKGWTHVATERPGTQSQSVIAKRLLEKSAHVNDIDRYKRTALHYAFLHRNKEAIRVLLKWGADLEAQDENDLTPLDYCCFTQEAATKILKRATGGPRGYTFTLEANNFHDETFYQEIMAYLPQTSSLNLDGIRQVERLNFRINQLMDSLDQHLEECRIDNILEPSPRFKALIEVQQALRSATAVSIFDNLNNEYFIAKKDSIHLIIEEALANPYIKDDHYLIKNIGLGVLNCLSLLCAGLPFLTNYYYTGRLFFSVPPSVTENLLRDIDRNSSILNLES